MIYVSKPNGTHAVIHSRTSMGAYEVVKLRPGTLAVNMASVVAGRDLLAAAINVADDLDAKGKS